MYILIGVITSTDDFIILKDRLLITESTIPILDESKYDLIQPKDIILPDFIRVQASLLIANGSVILILFLSFLIEYCFNRKIGLI